MGMMTIDNVDELTRFINDALGNTSLSVYVDKVPEYSLGCIELGQEFPSKEQLKRIKMYNINDLLLKGDLEKALPLIRRRISEMLEYTINAGSSTYLAIPSKENYYKIIADKVIRLSQGCGGPTVSSYIENKVIDTLLGKVKCMIDKKKIDNKLVRDVAVYGEAVAVVYKDASGFGIRVVEPKYWIPVVDPYTEEVTQHLIYKVIKTGNTELLVLQVHELGYYTKLVYRYDKGKLVELVSQPERVDTGLSDFAVKVINTEGSTFGYDMFTPIHSLVIQNVVDTTLHDFASNRNTVPMMQGSDQFLDKAPEYSADVDIAGQRVKRQFGGNTYFAHKAYYPIPGGDGTGTTPVKIEQIKIDIDTTSYLKVLEERRKSIGQLTGMVGTLRSFNNEGQAQSGKAKRLEYESDIQTVNNIVISVKDVLKDCVADCLKVIGLNVATTDICVDWKVDILLDEYEVAELEKMRLESNSTSLESSLIRQYGYTDEEVVKEIELIKGNRGLKRDVEDKDSIEEKQLE